MQNPYYYNFLSENDPNILKLLIMLLYEDLDKMLVINSGSTLSLRIQIEDLEKELLKKDTYLN